MPMLHLVKALRRPLHCRVLQYWKWVMVGKDFFSFFCGAGRMLETQELVVDFKCEKEPVRPAVTQEEEMEMVQCSRYLRGGHFNSRLDSADNTEALYKKGHRRLFFHRKLGFLMSAASSWGCFACPYSVLFYEVPCWGNKFSSGDTKCLNKLIKKVSSTSGLTLYLLQAAAQKRITAKLENIMNSSADHLHRVLHFEHQNQQLIPPSDHSCLLPPDLQWPLIHACIRSFVCLILGKKLIFSTCIIFACVSFLGSGLHEFQWNFRVNEFTMISLSLSLIAIPLHYQVIIYTRYGSIHFAS